MGKKRDNEELAEIGKRLKAARRSLGLKQKDICQLLNIKASTWSQWENGKSIPDPLIMKEFYLLYGITLNWVYVGDARKKRKR